MKRMIVCGGLALCCAIGASTSAQAQNNLSGRDRLLLFYNYQLAQQANNRAQVLQNQQRNFQADFERFSNFYSRGSRSIEYSPTGIERRQPYNRPSERRAPPAIYSGRRGTPFMNRFPNYTGPRTF